MLARLRATRANERGRALSESGDSSAAIDAYRSAIDADPRFASAWFNLALEYKNGHQWTEAMEAGKRAAELRPDDYPTWWNLGIAATALGEWAVARTAWSHCGITLPEGSGPPEGDLGPCPVRLDPRGNAEIVWAQRLDPARVRLLNVPLPSSGHRWHDIVLHDGVPVGEREWNGHRLPVFDELVRLVPSPAETWEGHVTAPSPRDSDDLEELVMDRGGAAQDWTRSVRHVCASCSEGTLPATTNAGEWTPRRHFGFALIGDGLMELLNEWQLQGEGRSFELPSLAAP